MIENRFTADATGVVIKGRSTKNSMAANGMADEVHHEVEARLRRLSQRYTRSTGHHRPARQRRPSRQHRRRRRWPARPAPQLGLPPPVRGLPVRGSRPARGRQRRVRAIRARRRPHRTPPPPSLRGVRRGESISRPQRQPLNAPSPRPSMSSPRPRASNPTVTASTFSASAPEFASRPPTASCAARPGHVHLSVRARRETAPQGRCF